MFPPRLTRAEIAGMSDDALVKKVNYRRKKYRDVPVALTDEEIAQRIKEFARVCGQIGDAETGNTQRKGRGVATKLELKWHKVSPAQRLVLGLVMSLGGLGITFVGMAVSLGATLSSSSPTGPFLILLAGVVVAVIGLIVTVICFARAIRT